jgi:hypothetical protein
VFGNLELRVHSEVMWVVMVQALVHLVFTLTFFLVDELEEIQWRLAVDVLHPELDQALGLHLLPDIHLDNWRLLDERVVKEKRRR